MDLRVADVMTRDVVTARPDQSLKDVARSMYERRVSGVPVVDENGHLVGILSEADLLRGHDPRPKSLFLEWLLHPQRLEEMERATRGALAGDLMVTPVVTVRPDTSIEEAIGILLQRGVKRLPVVDSEDRLVGVVSRHDLLSPFLPRREGG